MVPISDDSVLKKEIKVLNLPKTSRQSPEERTGTVVTKNLKAIETDNACLDALSMETRISPRFPKMLIRGKASGVL